MQIIEGSKKRFYGDEINSNYFWGDVAKEKIKFIRNRVFNGINTLKYDPKMPFREKRKIFSNYWFSFNLFLSYYQRSPRRYSHTTTSQKRATN